jgi:ribosomal peptide maturation radical SAM protein 1
MKPAHPLDVALVALPWTCADLPSAALSALSAYVRRERPQYTLDCHSEFVDVSVMVGERLYAAIAKEANEIGMLMYMPLTYPERLGSVREGFREWVAKRAPFEPAFRDTGFDVERTFSTTVDRLRSHVADLARRLSHVRVVGMTCTHGQLFANVALARELKRLNPRVTIVIGGARSIGSRSGHTVMSEYECFDYLVEGEGERALVALLDAIANGANESGLAAEVPVGGGIFSTSSAELRMDELPMPDYDEYAARADRLGVSWSIPVEGSRGCWWDRTKRTGDAKDTCFFCSLNVEWGGYREKPSARVVHEMVALSDRYRNLNFTFLDNILRLNGVESLAESMKRTHREYSFFHELRANATPYEMLVLSEAGLSSVQIGVEGLSASLLRRLNKGTSPIQNLAAMKTCAELGIRSQSNLIADFPGSTAQEVSETCHVIQEYALALPPLNVTGFRLTVASTVDILRSEFGVTNVRNLEMYRHGLPEDVFDRLELFDKDFDQVAPTADWTPVRRAIERWAQLHSARRGHLLIYRDGQTYITIDDSRFGNFSTATFEGLERDLYVYCMEIRTFDQIAKRFRATNSAQAIRDALQLFVDSRIMYSEQDRYLSLALAPTPRIASQRIRAARTTEPASEPLTILLHVVQ